MTSPNSIPRELGDFEILRELGRGGMGVVYEARQKSLNRRVALKVLAGSLGLTARAVMRFQREAEAAAKLHHTNIVPIYFTGQEDGVYFYAMELIDGPSLDQVIKHMRAGNAFEGSKHVVEETVDVSSQSFPDWVDETIAYEQPQPSSSSSTASKKEGANSSVVSGAKYFDTVVTMIADVADALQHAHDHGVISRDIKPSNLLLGSDGRLSVSDFGLARVLEQPGMTMTGEFVGTPRYMSPEQISAGRAPLDHRTDIYSLGATLYELLTLHPPFTGQGRDEIIGKILHKEPDSPRSINRHIPKDLETICLKAMERDPDRRYQHAGELAKDLRAFVNRFAISAKRVGPLTKTVRWAKRNPAWTLLFVIFLLGSLSLFAYLQTKNRAELRQAQELALAFSFSGEFERAKDQIELARSRGASQAWLQFAEGQIAVFQGEYDTASRLLSDTDNVAESIPRRCLLSIAFLSSGQETRHVEELLYIKDALERGDMNPQTETDFIYLGLAHMWADPDKALDFLQLAEDAGSSDRLLRLIRSVSNCYAAHCHLDPNKALNHAEAAVVDASGFKDFEFAISCLISAQTVAAETYLRNNESGSRQRAIQRAEEALTEIDADLTSNGHFNMEKYLFLLQCKGDDEAFNFLLGLQDHQLVSYMRTYRIIAQINNGDLKQARADVNAFREDDGPLFETNRRAKIAHLVLVELANEQRADQREALAQKFKQDVRAILDSDPAFVTHVETIWAVCLLLGLIDEADDIRQVMEAMVAKYRDTYIEQILQPVIEIAKGESPETVIESAEDSRRWLSFALFASGIDALARDHPEQARAYFEKCEQEGIPYYYVTHISRALADKLARDKIWPEEISTLRHQIGPDGEK